MDPIILLADDHSVVRKGLRASLKDEFGYISNVAEVCSCSELMSELKRKVYTHLVLDINFTDGNSLEVLQNIRNVYPEIRILIFSMQPDAIYRKALRRYGIRYFVSKNALEDETIRQFRRFLADEQPCPQESDTDDSHSPFTALSR